MSKLKWVAVPAALAALALAGCTKSGTVFGGGKMNRSVKYVGVSRKIEMVNAPELTRRGTATYFDVQLRNNDLKRKQWELEYMFQFYDATGRQLPSAVNGWRQLTIGRTELKQITGCCLISGAETATVTLRKWSRKH